MQSILVNIQKVIPNCGKAVDNSNSTPGKFYAIITTMSKISDLRPDDQNANRGTALGQKMIVGSIGRNKLGRSIVVDKNGVVIGGNKTLEAVAEVLGVDAETIVIESAGDKLIVHKRTDLDLDDPDPNNEARRLAFEDNTTSFFSFELDPEIVVSAIEGGFDFEAIGLESFDLEKMLDKPMSELLGGGEPKETPPETDKADELQDKWGVISGDLWKLGEHKLLCGDCRNLDDVNRLVGNQKVNGIFTSPPYAMQRVKQYGGVPVNEYVDWWEAVQQNMRSVLADDGSFFVNIKPHCEDGQRVLYVMDLVLAMVRQWDWRLVDELCWTRSGVPGKWADRFKNSFEPIYHFLNSDKIKFRPDNVSYYSKQTFTYSSDNPKTPTGFITHSSNTNSKHKTGLAYPGNHLDIHNAKGESLSQAAPFPLPLPTFFIKAYSDPGDIWLDPFCGSGTVIIAADNENRIGYGIEKLEKYCSVILQRYLDHTQIKPELIDRV